MRRALTILLLICCILANTIPRWIAGINGDIFCRWQAISFMLLAAAGLTKRSTAIERIIFDYVLLLSINNGVDECIGDPKIAGIPELAFAMSATLWTIYRTIKWRTTTRKRL